MRFQAMTGILRRCVKSLLAVFVVIMVLSLTNLPLPRQTALAQSQNRASVIRVVPKAVKVWIPRTGKKYHSNKKCSNMKKPQKIKKAKAKKMGYKACKKCY